MINFRILLMGKGYLEVDLGWLAPTSPSRQGWRWYARPTNSAAGVSPVHQEQGPSPCGATEGVGDGPAPAGPACRKARTLGRSGIDTSVVFLVEAL